MGKHSQFPWDLLKAECLRLVCSQLVQASNEGLSSFPGGGRKEEMIEFLRDVETRTLDAAVEKLQSQIQNSPRKSVGTVEPPSAAKRTRADEDTADDEDPEGYNTRYKGVKRVKVREEKGQTSNRTPRKSLNASTGEGTPVKRGRGRPRKSVPEGTTTAPAVSDDTEMAGAKEGEASTAEANDGETSNAGAKTVEISEPQVTKDDEADKAEAQEGVSPKRGRGRPRKSDPKPPKPKATPKPKPAPAVDAEGNPVKRGRGRPKKNIDATAPSSKGKEVFDGVHLQKRKTDAKEESGAAEGNADGEEEDAVLAAVNGGRDGLGDGASSLGGSNKENDPDDAFRYATEIQFPADHDVDMDADGDPDGEAEHATSAAPVAAA